MIHTNPQNKSPKPEEKTYFRRKRTGKEQEYSANIPTAGPKADRGNEKMGSGKESS